MTRAVERLTSGVNQLAEMLNLAAPVLPTAATLAKQGLQIVEGASSFAVRGEEGSTGIWDDEEEQKFYEDLVDLKSFVPASLLGIKEDKKGSAAAATTSGTEPGTVAGGAAAGKDADGIQEASSKAESEQRKVEEDVRRQLEELELRDAHGADGGAPVEADIELARTISNVSHGTAGAPDAHVEGAPAGQAPKTEGNAAGGEEDGLQSGPAARLTALFAALPEANNREVVDRLAVEFAFLNSKAARKRLIRVSVCILA